MYLESNMRNLFVVSIVIAYVATMAVLGHIWLFSVLYKVVMS